MIILRVRVKRRTTIPRMKNGSVPKIAAHLKKMSQKALKSVCDFSPKNDCGDVLRLAETLKQTDEMVFFI